jgi:hypothetical protein
MGQSLQDLEQRLLQSTANLLNQRAEVQKLKDSIGAAEASERRVRRSPWQARLHRLD